MLKTLPPEDVMYDALLRRDASFDGVFYAAVRTTGVFCRPICPARKPKRVNVEYFSGMADALAAGYRPCKRCRPLASPGAPPEIVARLTRAVEAEPARRWRADDVRAFGVDPSTARRQFKKWFGLTFAAYARRRRLGLALETLRNGDAVIEAQVEAGYESGSGFRDAFARLFGDAPAAAKSGRVLNAGWMDTPIGKMIAVADEATVYILEFADRDVLPKEIARLSAVKKAAVVPGRTPALDALRADLQAYFAHQRATPTAALSFDLGTPFQKQVWSALRAIPAGETRSYTDVARAIGRPEAVRAVARANATNPIAILTPCHRVIGSNGALTGYGGGVWRKRWLLDHESGIRPEETKHELHAAR